MLPLIQSKMVTIYTLFPIKTVAHAHIGYIMGVHPPTPPPTLLHLQIKQALYLSTLSCSKSTSMGSLNGGSVSTSGLTQWWHQIGVWWPLMVPQSSQAFCSRELSHTSSQLGLQTAHQTLVGRSSLADRCCPSLETSECTGLFLDGDLNLKHI